jgi:hypothetical protein
MISNKINRYLGEGGLPEWKGRGPHKKFADTFTKMITKYPDMPEELKEHLHGLIKFHRVESKKYTKDDVFPKE